MTIRNIWKSTNIGIEGSTGWRVNIGGDLTAKSWIRITGELKPVEIDAKYKRRGMLDQNY